MYFCDVFIAYKGFRFFGNYLIAEFLKIILHYYLSHIKLPHEFPFVLLSTYDICFILVCACCIKQAIS